MSLPRSIGQLPFSYDELPTGRPRGLDPDDDLWSRYIDEEITPLYPFGFGLSYTHFGYADLKLAADRVSVGDTIVATVEVTNRGVRSGREIVQLYVHQREASRSRPPRQLKGFVPVDLAPGETRRVEIRVPVADLGFHDDDGAMRIEPGAFDVFVGGSSAADLKVPVMVTEAPKIGGN